MQRRLAWRLRQRWAWRNQRRIGCGRTVVAAGDLIVGDRDGIAVVPLTRQVLGLVRGLVKKSARVADRRGHDLQGEIMTRFARKASSGDLRPDAILMLLMTPGPTRADAC
jgi:hypothetical protein